MKNQDMLIYLAATPDDTITRADFDKANLKTNIALDNFYSNKYIKYVIYPAPINPSKVIFDIKKKLTKIELAVLKKYYKFD